MLKPVSRGGTHSLVLRADGRVLGFGTDEAGESTMPATVQERVTAIAAGWNHSVALKADGTLVCWGDNSWGQCDPPTWVQSQVTAIAAGGDHTLAIIGTAALRCVHEQGDLVLSWPDNSGAFRLQTSSSMESGSWTDVPETPVLAGNRQTLRLPVGGEQRGYRLTRSWLGALRSPATLTLPISLLHFPPCNSQLS